MKSKKRFWMITAAVVTLIAVASVGIAVAADMTKNNQANNSASGDVVYLAEDTVKKLALNHAGLAEADVTELKVVLDYDDRKAEYEVKFRKDNVKYEYEIDAVSGTILSYDAESKKVLQNSTPAEDPTYITEDTAKEVALNHAGLAAADVTFTKVKLDYDDGKAEYEVDFYTDTAKYDYEVDAVGGTVLSYDVDAKQGSQPATGDAPAATPSTPAATPAVKPSTPTYMSQDEAKNIAVQHAGLQVAAVTFTKVKLDYDDGRAEYEVDFYTASTEYDYEIDATTGKILSVDTDARKGSTSGSGSTNNTVTAPTATPTYITQEAAKEVALKHAGLTEADVTRVKIELDYDDGRAEYEVDFRVGQVEYEYEINAVTGSIICFEKDIDD